jgi:hypothetical protein
VNPTVEALYIAAVAGVACGAIRVVLWRPVVRETRRATEEAEPEPVNELDADREDWDGELTGLAKELADARKKRAAKAAKRVETLRGIYLADLAAAAELPGEVPAR